MALPQAVQNAADQADALQQQIYNESQASVEPTEQTVSDVPAADPPSNVVEMPRQAEPVQQVETPKVQADDDAAYWRKKFESLQGKFNAEVPQLHAQLKEQNQQLSALAERLDAKAVESSVQDSATVTEKDSEEFGADLVDMTRRVAQDTVNKAVAQAVKQAFSDFRKEFGAVQEQMGYVSDKVAMSESDKFWAGVMNLVPDWKQIDADPRWIEWLDSTPDFAEDTYRELAIKAIQRGDALKVAKLVELWRGPQQTASAKPAINPELQRQVAPSTSKASAPTQQAERIWSKADYEAAYDVRNAQKLGTAEADRLIAEADRAVAEGRVRW